LVEYQLGTVAISHEDLMWSVTGQHRSTAYPGFSNEPLDGFKHLAADLTQYAQDFLAGSDPDLSDMPSASWHLSATHRAFRYDSA
jgi:O-succinylbenzoate synthase